MLNTLLAISLVNMDGKTILCIVAVIIGALILFKGMNTNPNGGNNNSGNNKGNSISSSTTSSSTTNTSNSSTNSNNSNM